MMKFKSFPTMNALNEWYDETRHHIVCITYTRDDEQKRHAVYYTEV